MFTKNNKDPQKPESTKAPIGVTKVSPPTLISKDLRIVGDLQSDGEVHIDGAVNGDIRSEILLIGETANITGEIVSDSVIIHGMVKGHIKAREVKLARTANVIGDILHEDLSIETGAFLEGHCKRIQGQIAPKIEFQTDQDKGTEPLEKKQISPIPAKTGL